MKKSKTRVGIAVMRLRARGNSDLTHHAQLAQIRVKGNKKQTKTRRSIPQGKEGERTG